MSNLLQLRLGAREIFAEAVRAVDAGEAVRRAVELKESNVLIGNIKTGNRRIYSIAVGKASAAMAVALDQILGESLAGGVVVDPRRFTLQPEPVLGPPWICCNGGHPLPSNGSLQAAEYVLELLGCANSEHALVIFLISGGGSAMIEWPITSDLTLANLRVANKALIASGASISEINAVRRAFSFIKGGRLAAKAPNCDQVTLIVSDVPSGQEWNVASGPTMLPPKDAPRAREVIARYHLRTQLPASVLRATDAESESFADSAEPSANLREHLVLLENKHALQAAEKAAKARGFVTKIAADITDESIEVGCKKLLRNLTISTERPTPACLISGGEFSCPVRGNGIGGRNLETALRLAIAADENRDQIGEFVALCAGTDGIDGNSPAAGAIVDSTTTQRARGLGLDPIDFLDRSDSYSFFVALGDAITTGLTGTNVRDLRILLSGTRQD